MKKNLRFILTLIFAAFLQILLLLSQTSKTLAVSAIPHDTTVTIDITGPNGESQFHLPSVQADLEIWYNIKITRLEPNKGYHLKIFKADGYDPSINGTGEDDVAHANGTESLCGYVNSDGSRQFDSAAISDSHGVIETKLTDSLLPDDPPTGNFVFEVATAQRQSGLTPDDCVRGDYVAHTNITIVETDKNYVPKAPPGEPGYNPCDTGSCSTAFGDIPTNITAFASTFLSIAIGIAGGIALILLVFGSIRILTSSGNQQSLAAGRDIIIAAIAGLLFLIFSVLILRALGVIIGLNFP